MESFLPKLPFGFSIKMKIRFDMKISYQLYNIAHNVIDQLTSYLLREKNEFIPPIKNRYDIIHLDRNWQ